MKPGFKFTFYDWFDDFTENPVSIKVPNALKAGDTFEQDGVTYKVKDAHVWHEEREGAALVRMTRYRIADTSTQFVHKCPAKNRLTTKLTRDDVTRIDSDKGLAKRKHWERVKLQSHNRLETKCPDCGVVFWKNAIDLPSEVVIDGVMKGGKHD